MIEGLPDAIVVDPTLSLAPDRHVTDATAEGTVERDAMEDVVRDLAAPADDDGREETAAVAETVTIRKTMEIAKEKTVLET